MVNDKNNMKRIEKLYPNATHPERMAYAPQEPVGGVQAVSVFTSHLEPDIAPVDTHYIKSLYPNATHPDRMSYSPQRPIGAVETAKAVDTVEAVTINTEVPVMPVDPNYITALYSDATHPERMAYSPQDPIGGVVKKIGTDNTEANANESSVVESLVIETPVIETNTSVVMATNIVAGFIVEGIGGIPPLESSIFYAGSQVARDAIVGAKSSASQAVNTAIQTETALQAPSQKSTPTQPATATQTPSSSDAIATNIQTGTIGEGVGGIAPLEGSVLYAGTSGGNTMTESASMPTLKNTTPLAGSAPYGASSAPESIEEDATDSMSYDVLIVGGGVSGLGTAIRIKQMAQEAGRDVSVCLVEKGSEIGSHIMSGAVLEPRALNELIPNWSELGAPLDTPALSDDFLFLTKNKSFKLPTPPQMHNKGNYIVSLGKFCKWLGGIAEDLGVEIYTGTSAAEILKENGRVVGIRSGAFGLDKNGEKTSQYVEGMELRATYTVLGEGCRGHLTKGLFEVFNLRENADPQTFGLGIKELWEIPVEKSQPGKIVHTTGYPMDSETYGGSFLYHLEDNLVAVGFVVGLDYKNPHISPYMEFQRFKHHPSIAKHLTGGRRISYGARAINEGGYQSIPSLVFKGGMLVGCTAGFLNVPKIKGSHTAMKSGMIAGEEIFKALQLKTPETDVPEILTAYPETLEKSWVYEELYKVRNIRPSFHKFKFFGGLVYSALATYVFRGKEPWTFKNHEDYSQMGKAKDYKKIEYPTPDGVLSFDRLTNVAFSGTTHSENQPCHLTLKDKVIPITVNLAQYDMPETRYCPAGVYELVEKDGAPALQINAQNCVHCKTCDIKDPCQNINWVVPEGGGGPSYPGM